MRNGRRNATPVAVIYLDLDRFKEVNDTLGHGAGDDLLCQVADRVSAVLSGPDVLARLGGDEFVVLTHDYASGSGPDAPIAVAERIRRILEVPFDLSGNPGTRPGAGPGRGPGPRAQSSGTTGRSLSVKGIMAVLRAPNPVVDDVVRRQLLAQSVAAAQVSSLLGVGLLVTVNAVLVVTADPTPGLGVWSALVLAWTLLFHLAVTGAVLRPAQDPDGPGTLPLELRFAALRALGGLAWGSICLFVRPGEDHPELIAVPAVVVMLSDAANLLLCAATPSGYNAYHWAVAITAGLGMATQHAWAVVAVIIFGAIGAPTLARQGYQQVAGARLLARQNLMLAAELGAERQAVERVNRRLSEANAELGRKATRDPLTGLPNRALFFDRLHQALGRARREGHTVGVIYFDVDRFKIVNDSLGHAAGDDLLVQVGHRVTAGLRESDLLARLGGDEFVVLTEDPPGSPAAAGLAERIRVALAEPFVLGGRSVRVTSSLGVAVDDGRTGDDQLVEFADVALYRAKTLGRNQVVRFVPELLAKAGRGSPAAPIDDERLNRLLAGQLPRPRPNPSDHSPSDYSPSDPNVSH